MSPSDPPATLFSSSAFPLTSIGPSQSYFSQLAWLFRGVARGQVGDMMRGVYAAYRDGPRHNSTSPDSAAGDELDEEPGDGWDSWRATKPHPHHVFLTQALFFIRGENLAVIESAADTLYRITSSPEGARATVDANVLEYVAELTSSPNEEVCKWTCHILRQLARHETTVRAAVGQLVSLLRQVSINGENLVGIELAATLYRIVISPEGAQAAVDANVLECVAELLSSPNASVRGWPCEMLRQLARHKTTVSPAVRQLVSLLRGGSHRVIESAAHTICGIATSPEGAQAAVDANVLEWVAELVSSPNASVRGWGWEILKQLARHETTASVSAGV
ncbi:armadillo-type protein [Mycena leptocephala]|nr:armadillo-type protein [Mycena leptocephala]